MHERKALMAELFATASLRCRAGPARSTSSSRSSLGAARPARQPLGLLDVRGYYAQLVAFLDHAVAERFVTPEHREMLVVEERPGALLEAFRRWRAPARPKWIDRGRS